jgi:7-cyano-7-deazaguanine reductase
MNDELDKFRWDIKSEDEIKPEILRTFPYEYKGKDIVIKIETDEFSAVCPWSGLPDYGKIIVEYIPTDLILELKSFKYYIYTYRNVGIYQEHAINRIFEDIVKILKPKWIKITLTYNVRGGMVNTVVREAKYNI